MFAALALSLSLSSWRAKASLRSSRALHSLELLITHVHINTAGLRKIVDFVDGVFLESTSFKF